MSSAEEPVLRMVGICKRFPGVVANDGVDLEVEAGEVHALLGENGAGKTTLMSILCGLYHPDEGSIIWKGHPVRFASPGQAAAQGIGMVHQDFKLIQRMTVAENIMLGRPPQRPSWPRRPFFDAPAAMAEVERVAANFGLPIDPATQVRQLSAGMQQRVAILRVLAGRPDLVIFDEPTSVLTPQEAESLFRMMRSLVAQGKSICFITHKLEEVMHIANRVTVLRDGRVIDTIETRKTSPRELARLMVGREVLFTVSKTPCAPKDLTLDVQNLTTASAPGQIALQDVSLQVRQGEILGVAGISGNGQNELAEAITGLRPVLSGQILLDGADIMHGRPGKIINLGVAYIPDKVRQNAVFMDLDLMHNTIAKSHRGAPLAPRGVFRMRAIASHVNHLLADYHVRAPGPATLARQLSGGNLQRVVLARELSRAQRAPRLIIAANPTAGLDVGATEYVHAQLLDQRDSGRAVLLISADLDELFALSDRIAVLSAGRIVGTVPAAQAHLEAIGLMMGGARAAGPEVAA
jgi:general nucleoside transport system ATP-binding protein